MNTPFLDLTIREATTLLKEKKISSRELVEAHLAHIEKKNPKVNAYLEVFKDALAEAKKADDVLNNGKGKELTGIPIAIKDNILIKGKKVGAGSKILEGYTATYDATVISKLRDKGAIFLGRTNMDEFAMGGSTENSAYGVTKNPHDEERVAGGSSGGSAAAVAMNGAFAALGSDTGGSVRQPASFCGVVGLKPTYGRVSRSGLIAMGSSLDQIGPIAKTVTDAQIIFNCIAGEDKLDSTSFPENLINQAKNKEKLTIGVPRHFLENGVDGAVLKNFNESVEKFKAQGYTIRDVKLPNIKYSLAVYYILMPAEASTNLARFDGVRYGLYKEGENLLADYHKTRAEGFGPEVRRRIVLGTYVLSHGYYDAYYTKANIVRNLLTSDFNNAWNEVDLIITPTTPTPAFKIGEKSADPLSMYLADIFTTPANLVGIPALSIPSGFVEAQGKKLPLGLQLLAPKFQENLLFKAGKKFLEEKTVV